MTTRTPWQGMWTIARLNWPFYLMALCVFATSICGVFWLADPLLRVGCSMAFLGAAYFLFISLGVSHLIYDSSDLYRWNWLIHLWRESPPSQAIFCHGGFDETPEAVRSLWPDSHWFVLNHFDESFMTEPSIQRARRLFPPTVGTLSAPFNRWPTANQSADLILGLLAIHELRKSADRDAWFSEAHRCLKQNGRVVLVEHLRDLPNFLAFGPGFLHFHSSSSWKRNWEAGGLRLLENFPVTPWVRVFVLGNS